MDAKDEIIESEFREMCRLHGCKCTRQRFAVFSYMRENGSHPNVDDVWAHVRQGIPSITRESVYRILNELSDYGVILRLDKIESARYDGFVCNHGHFICENCGSIVDFALPTDLELPQGHFVVHHTELRVSGLCAECAEKIKQKQMES